MEGVTKEQLENGYIIHNQNQISIEIKNVVYLYTVEDTEQFVIQNSLNEDSK
jgi:hypothetical protein